MPKRAPALSGVTTLRMAGNMLLLKPGASGRRAVDYYYEVEQGVAVTGGRRIGMCTTRLYNCLGVTAVNKSSRRGGLYHYPSLCRDKSYVVITLTRMLNNVLPEWIGITPAAVSRSLLIKARTRATLPG